jgi:hypothetical protein
MRTGRPSREIETALSWLKVYLSRGPVSAEDIKRVTPVSWHTTQKAKRELGYKSLQNKQGWFWYIPGSESELKPPKEVHASQATKSIDVLDQEVPSFDSNEDAGLDIFDAADKDAPNQTKEMLATIRHMHLNKHENSSKILRQVMADCRQYPNKPPYPESYIRALIRHIVEGDSRPALPEGITE